MTPKTKDPIDDECGETEDGACAEDQQDRSYYYDDAHGYEVYTPEENDEQGLDEEEPGISSTRSWRA